MIRTSQSRALARTGKCGIDIRRDRRAGRGPGVRSPDGEPAHCLSERCRGDGAAIGHRPHHASVERIAERRGPDEHRVGGHAHARPPLAQRRHRGTSIGVRLTLPVLRPTI